MVRIIRVSKKLEDFSARITKVEEDCASWVFLDARPSETGETRRRLEELEEWVYSWSPGDPGTKEEPKKNASEHKIVQGLKLLVDDKT